MISVPIKPITPENKEIIPEPAKSKAPILCSHPFPQIHDKGIGKTIEEMKTPSIRYVSKCVRSIIHEEMTDNTIWSEENWKSILSI